MEIMKLGSSVMVAHMRCGFDPHLPSKQTFEQRTNFGNSSFEDYRSNKNLKENVGLATTVSGPVRQHLNLTDGKRPLTTGKDCWQHGTDGYFLTPKCKMK